MKNQKKFLLPLLFTFSLFLASCQLAGPKQENRITASPEQTDNFTLQATPGPIILSGEETVRQFFALIDAQKQDEVMKILSDYMVPDEPTKIMWHDSFSSLVQAKLVSLQKWEPENWTQIKERFEVVVNTQTESGQLQYGWEVGENTRWIEVVKKPGGQEWQINEIATGP